MPTKNAFDLGLVRTFKITANGSPTSDTYQVIELRVHQVVAGTTRATIRIIDEDFSILDSSTFDLSTAITINLGDGGGSGTLVFTGEVTAVTIEQAGTYGQEIVVEAMDKSHRLGRSTLPATYVNMSYADVVRQLCGDDGVSVGTISGANLDVVHPYLMKSGTAFEFFDHIALQTGAHWYMDTSGSLHFIERAQQTPAVQVTWGDDLIKFRARYSDNGRVDKVVVTSWDYQNKTTVSSEDASELSGPTGGPDATMASTNRTKYSNGRQIQISTSGAVSSNEAAMLAKSIGRRQALNELTVRGEAMGFPMMSAGMTATIANVGVKLSGDYYLTSVEHVMSNGDLVTRFTAGGLQGNTIVDLVRGRSNPGLTPWNHSQLVIGIVTNNQDTDLELGRVKVKFPTFSDADESTWARVVHPGAGSERGMHFIPNIDDEVLVAFEQGDLRRPVVLGGLWNGTAKPWAASGANLDSDKKSVQWGIKTRTGHTMVFNEDAGDDKNSYVLTMKDGTIFHVGHDKIELISKNAKPIEVKTGEADLVMKDGNVTLKGKDITIEATGNITLKATGDTVIKGMKVAAEATGQMELKSNGGTKVTTSAMLELKGSLTKIN